MKYSFFFSGKEIFFVLVSKRQFLFYFISYCFKLIESEGSFTPSLGSSVMSWFEISSKIVGIYLFSLGEMTQIAMETCCISIEFLYNDDEITYTLTSFISLQHRTYIVTWNVPILFLNNYFHLSKLYTNNNFAIQRNVITPSLIYCYDYTTEFGSII